MKEYSTTPNVTWNKYFKNLELYRYRYEWAKSMAELYGQEGMRV